jgi:hypothetical protein
MNQSLKHPDHSSRGHHPQGPSQLKALKLCSGFENRPGTTAAAEMGTRIHEGLEVRDPSNLESELEIELYDKCIGAEDRLIADYFGEEKYERHNELPLTISLNNGLETWGTGDVLCISESGMKGLQIDYKSGRMKVDDAKDNYQAWGYKNGAYERFPKLETLRFIFLAPQINWINWHDFGPESVDIDRQLITTIVHSSIETRKMWADGSISKNPERLTPNDHCSFCRHSQYCPSINGVLLDFAESSGIQVPDYVDINHLDDPGEVSKLYGLTKLLEPLLDKIKKAAVSMAQEGEVLPGWELRSMGSKRQAADNKKFWEYAADSGITLEDLLENVNIPVAKFRDILKDKAERGQKAKAAKEFEERGVDMGVIVFGKERFTLRNESSDE